LRAPLDREPQGATEFCDFYNDWIALWCARAKGRFHGVAVVPLDYVDDAIAVMRRAKKLGLVRQWSRRAQAAQPRSPDLDAFYRAATISICRSACTALTGIPSAEDRRRPLRQLHQVHCHLVPLSIR